MEKFDYVQTVKEIENIISGIEDPSTPFEKTEELMQRARENLDRCYEYLRREREEENQ